MNNVKNKLIRGVFYRLWMTSPFLKFVIVFILLNSLVVSLDDSNLVSLVESNLRHRPDLLEGLVGLVVAPVHLGLDDEGLADVQDLGVHQGLGRLLPALDHVPHGHHAAVDDIEVLKMSR